MTPKSALLAGTLAAVGASVCCVGPLLLLLLGISGAWISRLTTFEPFRPIFVVVTLISLAFAFWKLYLAGAECAGNDLCADERVRKKQRRVFWLVAVPVVLLLTFPWYAHLLF